MYRQSLVPFALIVTVTLFLPAAFAEKKGGEQATSSLSHVPAPTVKSRTVRVTGSKEVRSEAAGACETALIKVQEAQLAVGMPATVKRTIKKLPAGATVVLDTNVLMKYPDAMWNYPGLRVVIPKQVIRELDNNNHRDNIAPGTKANIRAALRQLKALATSKGPWSSAVQEVDLEDGSGTVVVFDNRDHLSALKKSKSKIAKAAIATLHADNADDKIIAAAAYYYENKGSVFKGDVALVTGDGVAMMSALEVGLNALEHSTEAHYAQEELDGKIYNGRMFIDLNEKQYDSLIGQQTIVKAQLLKLINQSALRLYPNQFVVFLRPGDRAIYQEYVKGESDGLPDNQLIGCYNAQKDIIEMIPAYGANEVPVDFNLEQRMAFYAALNPRIRRLIMTGKAGTGKTVIALLAARMQLASAPINRARDRFDGIVMTKTDDPVGDRDPGFLPGSIEEKLGPVYASYKDALTFVIAREKKLAFKMDLESGARLKNEDYEVAAEKAADDFIRSSQVQIAHFGFFRGRTFRHRLVIFDEAQNLSQGEMKTLATRIGERAKLIVMGDVNQIDGKFNDRNNGLSDLITLTVGAWDRNIAEGGAWKPGADQSAVVKLVRSRREVLVEWTTQLYEEQE